MNSDKLYEMAENVSTRIDFINFVSQLNEDYKKKSIEWQNVDLSSFLDGLSEFSRDMDGYYLNTHQLVDVEKITWRMAAQMLLASTVYGA